MRHAAALARVGVPLLLLLLLLLLCPGASECGRVLFYNRVPKSGSKSLWSAIASAANQSQGRFKWHGVRYHARVNLQLADSGFGFGTVPRRREAAVPGSPAVQAMCAEFLRLAALGDGAYALHTPYVDFAHFCPGSGLEVAYINFLRDPVDREISEATFEQACICKNIPYPADALRDNLWCKHMITDQLRREYKSKPANHYCTRSVDALVAKHFAGPHDVAVSRNAYLRYFCGWNPEDCRGNLRDRLAAAVRHLETRYAWVGILELPDSSMRVLRAKVPMLSRIADIQHVTHTGDLHTNNASHGHSYAMLSPEVLARARAALAPDYAIYNRTIEILQGQVRELGGARA